MSDTYTVGIPLASRAQPGKEFVHIFMMDDTDTVGIDHQLYNVKCFRNVAELMTKTVRYSPRYLYMPVSLMEKSVRQTNFILSDRYLLTYSETLNSAVLYDDPSVIELYRDIFSEYLMKSKSYAETVNFTDAIREDNFLSKFLSKYVTENELSYCFCPGICASLAVEGNETFVEDYIRDDFPDKELLVRYYRLYRDAFQKGIKKLGESCHVISAANALEHFARTGYVNEVPRKITLGLDRKGRVSALRKWDHIVKTYNVQTIRDQCIPVTSSLTMLVFGSKAILSLVNEERLMTVQICVNESGIVELLCAYLEKLEKESAMTKEEYREFMDGLIAGMTG